MWVKKSVAASTTSRRVTARTTASRGVEGGKTRSRYLSAEQAVLVRQQVEAGQEFRRQLERYWQACEQWGDAQLEDSEAAS